MRTKENLPGHLSITKDVLANGLTVICDRDLRFNACSLAVIIRGGSSDEELNGITHLLEHLFFRKTKQKNSREIAELLDRLGGDTNAYTDGDSLCLYGTVTSGKELELLSLFAELIKEADFGDAELAIEREIIRQEILDATDDPIDATYQLFRDTAWKGSPVSRPVFGSVDTINQFTVADVQARLRQLTQGKRIIIAVAGNFDQQRLIESVEQLFGAIPAGENPVELSPTAANGLTFLKRPVGQIYFFIGLPWPGLSSPDYLTGVLAAAILGPANTSRMFRALREESGLCYDIDVGCELFKETGLLVVSGAVERKNLDQLLALYESEITNLTRHAIQSAELDRTKCMLTAQLEMDDDLLRSRLWRMVDGEMNFGCFVPLPEVLAKLQATTLDDINLFFSTYLKSCFHTVTLGGDVTNIKGLGLNERKDRK